MARVITLLTDFGLEDGYVAVMKGVISGIAPEARLVDITHLVPPQDVAFARFRLLNVAPFFPAGTVHLVVVDPGVGTARRALAVFSGSGSYLVGPDNGVLLGALETDPPAAVVELAERRFWRTADPSPTFHGRDIFSPVAAHLARGVALEDLGPPVASAALVKLELPACETIMGGVRGALQAVDRFGNLITNVPESFVRGRASWTVSVGERTVSGRRTYADARPGEVLALVGSHGFVEVAVHQGDARKALGASVGARVEVLWNVAR